MGPAEVVLLHLIGVPNHVTTQRHLIRSADVSPPQCYFGAVLRSIYQAVHVALQLRSSTL